MDHVTTVLSSISFWYFVPWGGYTNSYYPLKILHYSFIRLITYEKGSGKPRFSFGHYNRSYPALNWSKLWEFQTVGPIINAVIIVVQRSELRWLSSSYKLIWNNRSLHIMLFSLKVRIRAFTLDYWKSCDFLLSYVRTFRVQYCSEYSVL